MVRHFRLQAARDLDIPVLKEEVDLLLCTKGVS
jgi:hypothetical protein